MGTPRAGSGAGADAPGRTHPAARPPLGRQVVPVGAGTRDAVGDGLPGPRFCLAMVLAAAGLILGAVVVMSGMPFQESICVGGEGAARPPGLWRRDRARGRAADRS